MSAPCPTFGFIVHVSPDHDATALRIELTERLAGTGLVVSRDDRASEIIVTRESTQATDSDRQLVISVLNSLAHTGAAKVSDLVDLSY